MIPPSASSKTTAISVVGVEAKPALTTSTPQATRVPHTSCSTMSEKDGSISDVKVVRGRHPELDKEAVRVVKKITKKFTPAKINGKNVRYKFIIPVSFKLTDDDINTEEKK